MTSIYYLIPLIFLFTAVMRIKHLEKIVTKQNDILKEHLDLDAIKELEKSYIKKSNPFSPKVAKIWMGTTILIIVFCITFIILDLSQK